MLGVTTPDIADDLRQFIFEHVDSVGQLDVLLYMRENAESYFTADTLSKDLRTSASLAAGCLTLLNRSGLLTEREAGKGEFKYAPPRPEIAELITKLAAVYKIKPHKILELIFSSTKRARQFADAFQLSKTHKPGDENG